MGMSPHSIMRAIWGIEQSWECPGNPGNSQIARPPFGFRALGLETGIILRISVSE